MKVRLIVIVGLIIISDVAVFSCSSPAEHKAKKVQAHMANPPAIPKEPDITFLRKRLFHYFESHKGQNVFDTTDFTYTDYWGIANYAPYSVQAGHLFNDSQFHAVMIFSDSLDAEMRVYLRSGNRWIKIYEETDSIDKENPLSGHPLNIEYVDWNGDGTKDICFSNIFNVTRWSEQYALWLVDKTGKKIYFIKNFESVNDPQPDSVNGGINSIFYHAGVLSFNKYRFVNYKLKHTNEVIVYDNMQDSTKSNIEFYHKNKLVKKIEVAHRNVYKYVPAQLKNEVIEYFNSN